MKQASLNLDLLSKKTRKQTFLEEMEKVVPWADLEALIAPYYCEGVKGRPPFALQTMLRTHFMQQCSPCLTRQWRRRLNMRVDPDVLNAFKATGPGWQTRINAALRDAVEHGLAKA